ncbi:MAG TPA: GvpL/GvpF family gas vesicle protein [Gemmatimonadaceae bacterium]|nr:GvpL/GvpF family gas vesicle protein [Gemmatimonadaceae bacterium]
MPDRVLYAYGVTPPTIDPGAAPAGIDGAAVRVIVAEDVAALVSSIDAEAYAPERVEELTEDVEWLAPRASAHDAVVTWASDRGAVVPLPIFTLFRNEARVTQMLRERGRELRAAMERVGAGEEFGLRIFRLDDVLARHVGALSPRLGALERQAGQANPGQRYLLERKLESERRDEMLKIGADVAREVFDVLTPLALESTVEPLPAKRREDAAGVAVLNAFFLVRRGALAPFQEALTAIVRERAPHGFRFDFSGPWPPYHFVGERAGAGSSS